MVLIATKASFVQNMGRMELVCEPDAKLAKRNGIFVCQLSKRSFWRCEVHYNSLGGWETQFEDQAQTDLQYTRVH